MKTSNGRVLWYCIKGRGDPKDCVDWAINRLADGNDTPSLRILAGLSHPLNAFEVKERTLAALAELNITNLNEPDVVKTYTRDLVQEIVEAPAQVEKPLKLLSELDLEHGNLHNFYLLFHAYSALQEETEQHYWDGATRDNIVETITTYCIEWLEAN